LVVAQALCVGGGGIVSEAQTLLLGAIAGLTVLLGIALVRYVRGGQVLMNSLASGVLVYLLGDMLARAFAPLNNALLRQHDNLAGSGTVVWMTVAFIGGLVLGYGGLTAYSALSSNLPLLLAVGVGLHNLGEGLALGNMAGNEWVSISVVLVIGYVLQNLVVGGAIVAPFAEAEQKPRWPHLLVLGLIAGIPTIVGTFVGWLLVDEASTDRGTDFVGTAMNALAAGAILFVLIQLLSSVATAGRRTARHLGILAGLAVVLLTEVLLIGATGA
jgi:zinc transporter, ZIP family